MRWRVIEGIVGLQEYDIVVVGLRGTCVLLGAMWCKAMVGVVGAILCIRIVVRGQ